MRLARQQLACKNMKEASLKEASLKETSLKEASPVTHYLIVTSFSHGRPRFLRYFL